MRKYVHLVRIRVTDSDMGLCLSACKVGGFDDVSSYVRYVIRHFQGSRYFEVADQGELCRVLQFRLTEEDMANLSVISADFGISYSAFVRFLIRSDPQTSYPR